MSNPYNVLRSLSICRPGPVTCLPESAPIAVGTDAVSGVEINSQPSKLAQILTMPSRSAGSITARQLKEPTGSEVVAIATEAKAEELTAKYQPIVDQQLASRFPNLGSARKDLVESVTRELVDRSLFTE